MKREWQQDDVIVFDEAPSIQMVLWQQWSDSVHWQVMQVYHLTGALYTVNFAGVMTNEEIDNATLVGKWDDHLRRVVEIEAGVEPAKEVG